MTRAIAFTVAFLAIPLAAWAVDKSITLPPDHAYGTLRPGPGVQITQHHCAPCHSTDYIVMQPRGDAKQWQAVVMKMIKVYGAPITEQDAKAIGEYLSSTYGPVD